MKKWISVLLACTMTVSFSACAGGNSDTSSAAPTAVPTTALPDNGKTAATTAEDASNLTEQQSQFEVSAGSNVLVAYFSATNTTAGVAQAIADSLGADLYEIIPTEPYSDEDLDYHDDNSRTTIEMNDPNVRPEISGSVENMPQYDIVFIGYPIWWGEAPRIVSTFVERYDFSGKTVIPFCTSGGSGVGDSGSNLEALSSGGTWLPGTRLQGSTSHADIVSWVNSLGLPVTVN